MENTYLSAHFDKLDICSYTRSRHCAQESQRSRPFAPSLFFLLHSSLLPPQATIDFSVTVDYLYFVSFYMNGIIQFVFIVWLGSLGVIVHSVSNYEYFLLHVSIIHFFLLQISIPLYQLAQSVYPFICGYVFEMFPVWGYYKFKNKCYEHSCPSLCMDIYFHFSRSEMLKSYVRCKFIFLKKKNQVFSHSGWALLHSY